LKKEHLKGFRENPWKKKACEKKQVSGERERRFGVELRAGHPALLSRKSPEAEGFWGLGIYEKLGMLASSREHTRWLTSMWCNGRLRGRKKKEATMRYPLEPCSPLGQPRDL